MSIGSRVHTRFRTYKAAYLLAYLALHPQQPQPRERLIELFWADKEDDAGRAGLSTALAQLRRQLETDGLPPDSLLVADRHQVQINADTVGTDVADFERLLRQVRQSEERSQQIALLRQAADLYRGELLAGCYEEWATGMQTHFQSLYLEGLRRLIRLLEETDQVSEALVWAQKATLVDPYAEEIYRAQMRLLVRLRQPSVALQTYERLEQLFRRNLSALPSPATRQMADAIRQDPRALALLRAEAEAQSAGATATVPAPVVSTPETDGRSPAAPTLPLQLTRFFGRRQEQEQLKALLLTPGVRLVSLLGPGGAGKTRLAVEVGGQVIAAFANRVWFVPLADIPDASLIASTLVNNLHVPSDGLTDPLERVIHFLGDSSCLLILDNLEHLLRHGSPGKSDHAAQHGCVAVIRLLLARLPGLVCLATSRQALRLAGEQEFPLPPLPLPAATAGATVPELLVNESVALYVDRARAVRLDFTVTEHNVLSIVALCRRLEGIPLAIEMAAAWAKITTPQKMLERLEHQLSLLVSRRRDLPPRHQSLRATIEWSYDLLEPRLREVFATLSVFRGGWTLDAAEAVCGQDVLQALMELHEHSLIVAEEKGGEPRYRMLEPLREFALEKLAERGQSDMIAGQHAAWCLEMAQASQATWDGPEQNQLFACLQNDLDNLRAALDWFYNAAEGGLDGLIMTYAIQRFWRTYGYLDEARRYLRQALAHPGAGEMTPERARALNGLGLVEWTCGDYVAASALFSQVLEAFRARDDRWGMAAALGNLGNIAQEVGDLERAQILQQESLALYRDMEHLPGITRCLTCLANIANDLNDFATALEIYAEALRIQRKLQFLDGQRGSLNGIIFAALHVGDMQTARRSLREALLLAMQSHDLQENAYLLGATAEMAQLQDLPVVAAQLFGAMLHLRSEQHLPLPPGNHKDVNQAIQMLKDVLGAVACETWMAKGAALTWKQSLQLMEKLV